MLDLSAGRSEEHRILLATELGGEGCALMPTVIVVGVRDRQLEEAGENEITFVVREIHTKEDDGRCPSVTQQSVQACEDYSITRTAVGGRSTEEHGRPGAAEH